MIRTCRAAAAALAVLTVVVLPCSAQWLFTSPDIYQDGSEIVLRSAGHLKRAIHRETRGDNWVLEGSLKWQAGDHGQAGVFFCYGDTSSYYFLSFGPKLEIIRGDTEVLEETDFAYERGRWYRYRIQRRGLSFTVSVDGRERMRFRDDLPLALNTADARDYHPLRNGGFAVGSRYPPPGASEVHFKDFSVRGDAYTGQVMTGIVHPVALMRGRARLTLWVPEHTRERYRILIPELAESLSLVEEIIDVPFPPLLDPEITEAPIRTPYNGYSSLFLKELGAGGLMLHEMAHWWHNVNVFRSEASWIREGWVNLISLLAWCSSANKPVVMKESAFYANLFSAGSAGEFDLPLEEQDRIDYYGEPRKAPFAYYGKPLALFYIFYREVGLEGLRALHRFLHENAVTLTSESLFANLKRFGGKSLGHLKPGWVAAGRYGNLGIRDAQDADHDGLTAIDEAYLGTRDTNPDSDGDGYADGWEVYHDFDPASPAQPSGYDDIALDGIPDDTERLLPAIGRYADPANDGAGRVLTGDIKGFAVYRKGEDYILTARFHNDITLAQDLLHTFHIQAFGDRKINYWVQWSSDRLLALARFPDGTPFEKWTKLPITEKFKGRVATGGEWVIPQAFFGKPQIIQIKYMSGPATEFNQDSTGFLKFKTRYFEPGRLFIEGDIGDLLRKSPLSEVEDPPADDDGCDIRKLYLHLGQDALYLGARYATPLDPSIDRLHTFHIRAKGLKENNFWIQFNNDGIIWVARFPDGAPFENWSTLPMPEGFESGLAAEGEWKIPLVLFENAPVLEVSYLAGTPRQVEQDRTSVVKLKTRYFDRNDIFLEGDLADLLELRGLASLEDERGDTEAPASYDIASIHAAVSGAGLLIGASFFETSAPRDNVFHTFHVKALDGEAYNYWIQWNGAKLVGLSRFKDGTPFEQWQSLPLPKGFEIGLGRNAEWRIPLEIFRPASRVRVSYIAGGFNGQGQSIWNVDTTGWLELPLR